MSARRCVSITNSMASRAAPRLPEPVDAAPPPKRLLRAAAVVVLGGLVPLFFGALAGSSESDGGTPLIAPEVFLLGWLLSLPLGALLLAAYGLIGRRRLRRFERRAGFLPRPGRTALPATGRTILFRVEYGTRGDRVCLMVAEWNHYLPSGWRRRPAVEHVWLPADGAVAIGEARTRLTALAEQLEEQSDDARLRREGDRVLAEEALAERHALDEQTHRLAERLAAMASSARPLPRS